MVSITTGKHTDANAMVEDGAYDVFIRSENC